MKMPTSSSVLLATLAISSSSSCLAAAAPIGDGTQDTAMTSSSSSSRISSFHGGSAPRAFPAEMDVQGKSETITERTLAYPGHLETRDGLVNTILQKIEDALGVAKSMDVDGTTSNINSQLVDALKIVLSKITSVVDTNGTVPSQAKDEVSTILPTPTPSALSGGGGDSGSSGSSYSAAPTAAAAAVANDGAAADAPSSASYTSASASPSSPPLPGNPPNSPALPVNV